MVAAGIASGVLVWVSACALGLSLLFEHYPPLEHVMMLTGACYFMWIGLKTIHASRSGLITTLSRDNATLTSAMAWRRGLLIVLTNPKAAIMWAAVTALLSGGGLDTVGVMYFAPIGALSALLIYGGYAVLFSTKVARRFHERTATSLQFIFGSLFTLLGLKLLLDGINGFRAAV